MIGRRVDLVADLEQVVVTCDGVEVARHRRCWARHQSITDPAHAAAATRLRAAHQARTHRAATGRGTGADTDVEHRDLADYDRILGLTTGPQDPGESSGAVEPLGAVSA